MASVESERSDERPLPSHVVEASATERPQLSLSADPYEAAVDRLLALLEENQVAIATLARAFRHKSRLLELTQAELAHTQETLAAERRIHRRT